MDQNRCKLILKYTVQRQSKRLNFTLRKIARRERGVINRGHAVIFVVRRERIPKLFFVKQHTSERKI